MRDVADEESHRRRVNARLAGITPRELQVLQLAAEGLTYEEIGCRLFIATETAKSHMRQVRLKLRVHSRSHAIAVGFRKGMLA